MRRQYLTTPIPSNRLYAHRCAVSCATHNWRKRPKLQEWRYSSGIILEKLFAPEVPEWRVVLGAAAAFKPLYDGARPYRTQGGPVSISATETSLASVGEGVGVNLLSGKNYRAGVALDYDLGRRVEDDESHLRGLGDIPRRPVIKAFASYVISKELPIVFRVDVRRVVGGTDGLIGDLEVYAPLPGSSKKFFMFAGPSITFANRRYLQNTFGVSASQALASGHPEFDARGGADSVGLGFSATRFVTERWLLNLDLAVNRLLGSASQSPITQENVQHVAALSVAYSW